MEGREKPKKETGHFRLVVAGLISRQHTPEVYLWWLQEEQISAPACQVLKVYTEALTGFSHINHADGLNITSVSQGCVLGAVSRSGKGKQNPYSKGNYCPAHRSTSDRCFSMTTPNNAFSHHSYAVQYWKSYPEQLGKKKGDKSHSNWKGVSKIVSVANDIIKILSHLTVTIFYTDSSAFPI